MDTKILKQAIRRSYMRTAVCVRKIYRRSTNNINRLVTIIKNFPSFLWNKYLRAAVRARQRYQRSTNYIERLGIQIKNFPSFFWNKLKELEENHIAFNLHNLFIVACFIFVYSWLREPIMDAYKSLVVVNTFDKLPKEPLGLGLGLFYLIIVGTAIIYLYFKYKPEQYKPSTFLIAILIFSSVIYTVERLDQWGYEFQPIFGGILRFFAVLDPPFLAAFTFGICYIVAEIKSERFSASGNFINSDHPIEDISDDEFERNIFITKLADWLNGFDFQSKQSFVIGINGSWGFGKTSILNMLQNKIIDEAIKVRFNPWIANKDYNLIKDFFNTLDDEISQHISTSNIFQKYGKRLTKVEDDRNPLKALSNFFEEEPLYKSFSNLTNLLKKLGKPVYVFIDDIDRLNKEEVYEILRLIRSSASFSYLTFIIAYDRVYIEQALKAMAIPESERYLQKIIQLEIKLPVISEMALKNAFVKEVERQIVLTKLNTVDQRNALNLARGMILGNALAPGNLKYNFNIQLSNIFKNKRDIVRFANAFILRLSFYYDQVYVPDLFLVEIIRIYFPSLHERISFQNNNYIEKPHTTSSATILDTIKDPTDPSQSIQEDPQILPEISKLNLNDEMKEVAKNLINALISEPVSSDFNNDHGIYYKDYYDSYFTLNVPTNVVNLATVQNLLRTNIP